MPDGIDKASINFEEDNHYNPEANYTRVRFGAGATILEVEANELQRILMDNMRRFSEQVIGSGILNLGTITITGGTLTVKDEVAVVNGLVSPLGEMTISVAEGDTVYVNFTEEVKSYISQIKKLGNKQSTENIPNKMYDPREDAETSKRMQLTYTLTKDENLSGINIPLCNVLPGRKVEVIKKDKGKLFEKVLEETIEEAIKESSEIIPVTSNELDSIASSGDYFVTDYEINENTISKNGHIRVIVNNSFVTQIGAFEIITNTPRSGFTTATSLIAVRSKHTTDGLYGDWSISADYEITQTNIHNLSRVMLNHRENKENPHGVTKKQVGLENLSDFPVSSKEQAETGTHEASYMTPQRTKEAIDSQTANKVDKETGKGLSTNDFTDGEKTKLEGIATGANNYTHPATHPPSIIAETTTKRFVTDAEKVVWNAKATTSQVDESKKITDTVTKKKWEFGIENGLLFIEEV